MHTVLAIYRFNSNVANLVHLGSNGTWNGTIPAPSSSSSSFSFSSSSSFHHRIQRGVKRRGWMKVCHYFLEFPRPDGDKLSPK